MLQTKLQTIEGLRHAALAVEQATDAAVDEYIRECDSLEMTPADIVTYAGHLPYDVVAKIGTKLFGCGVDEVPGYIQQILGGG